MNQRDGVFTAVSEVVGELNGAISLSKDQKKLVYAIVFAAFKSGQIEHKSLPTDAELTKYIPGLVNNWTRKDSRLNGGGKYVSQHPGTRVGSGDEALKAMRSLLKATTDKDAVAQIQSAINQRVAELKPKRVINLTALPEALRHLATV